MTARGEKNSDVLQNIEFSIVAVYRADRSLLDLDVKDAVDALVRRYHSEEENRRPPSPRLGPRAEKVFASVLTVCEWRLGRSQGPGAEAPPVSKLPVAELVYCLRQIQKSVPRWTQREGRQGYLNFVSQFLP